MTKSIHITTAVAALLTAGILSAPTLAQTPGAAPQMDESRCISEFSKVDANKDERLAGSEMSKYNTVKSQVDTDGDGNISSDEYIVACKQGEFESIYKNQG